jgi:hypothetical protein
VPCRLVDHSTARIVEGRGARVSPGLPLKHSFIPRIWTQLGLPKLWSPYTKPPVFILRLLCVAEPCYVGPLSTRLGASSGWGVEETPSKYRG